MQPYRRWDISDPLWLVHTLDIVDKHRRLNLVSPLLRRAQWIGVGGDVTDIERFAGPFEDGTPVARFKMVPDSPSANMHVQTNFLFDIAFGEGVIPLQGHPLMVRLEGLATYVGGAVARFDRFFT